MEANLNETIDILRSKEFDIEVFNTIIKGHVGELRQCLETGQKIFLSLVPSLSFEERSAYADQIMKYETGTKK